ncbi:MAG: alkaline phosphatase [Longimicrobiales bacterium]
MADEPSRIILFIGDGTGLAYWTAAGLAAGEPLAVEGFPVVGLIDTQASDARVTDSAAGATAYSAGVRTYNGAIGVDADTQAVETVLEIAERRGLATGLVSTSSVTHATPASFAAHVPSRGMEEAIAAQMAGSGVDVLIGGGRDYFAADTRSDGRDFLTPLTEEAAHVSSASGLRALDPDTVDALVAFLADTALAPATGREIRLADMTRAALGVLEHDDDGFFLMVEGSQIDWHGHDNAPLPDVVAEVLDLDGAIAEAIAFQRRHPETLIVVTADHETGGLSLIYGETPAEVAVAYTTRGHTGTWIPLFARGPGAEAFGGVHENYEIGLLLLELVRGDRAATGRP